MYMILGEDIKTKDIPEGYKTYKMNTEKEIEDRMEDIMSELYDVFKRGRLIFTMNANSRDILV